MIESLEACARLFRRRIRQGKYQHIGGFPYLITERDVFRTNEFFSPGPIALRWGIVDKLQRSENKSYLVKSWY